MTDELRIYITTRRHLYIMLAHRHQLEEQDMQSQTGLAPFFTALMALPFTGGDWCNVAADLLRSRATLVQVPFRYQDEALGAPRVLPDPKGSDAPPAPVTRVRGTGRSDRAGGKWLVRCGTGPMGH
jgi:hypothetical protein